MNEHIFTISCSWCGKTIGYNFPAQATQQSHYCKECKDKGINEHTRLINNKMVI